MIISPNSKKCTEKRRVHESVDPGMNLRRIFEESLRYLVQNIRKLTPPQTMAALIYGDSETTILEAAASIFIHATYPRDSPFQDNKEELL